MNMQKKLKDFGKKKFLPFYGNCIVAVVTLIYHDNIPKILRKYDVSEETVELLLVTDLLFGETVLVFAFTISSTNRRISSRVRFGTRGSSGCGINFKISCSAKHW